MSTLFLGSFTGFIMTARCHLCGRVAQNRFAREHWLTPYFLDKGQTVLQTQICRHCARSHPSLRVRALYWIRIVWKLRIGRISSYLTPGYSVCGRCRTTWAFVRQHCTNYNDHSGMFPLCEQCWAALSPKRRLPYYRKVWRSWGKSLDCDDWRSLERNVLNGG
jgi:hypothetical protein